MTLPIRQEEIVTRKPEVIAEAAWRAGRKNGWLLSYVFELHGLATRIVEGCDRVFAATATDDEGIWADGTSLMDIHEVLLNACRIRNLTSAPKKGRPAAERELQRLRANTLVSTLHDVDLRPLRDARLRNILEHYDEYLDETLINCEKGTILSPTFVVQDQILSHRTIINELFLGPARQTYLLRVYIADEKVFHVCGESVGLQPIRNAGAAVAAALRPILEATHVSPSSYPGGYLRVIGEAGAVASGAGDVISD